MTKCAVFPLATCLVLALLLTADAGAQTPAPAATAPPPERTTAISGYMDFHFNKQEFADGRLDFHRFVLLITHRFSDRIRFVSELELEHALVEGLEEAGELELEQAYMDFLLKRGFNLRSEEHTSELQSQSNIVCRLLLEKK